MNFEIIMLSAIMYIVAFFFGASIFSFVNVVAVRLPQNQNYISGHSICSNCGLELKWYHMVPIFSYIFLGGKCSACKQKISIDHLLVEIVGGFIAVWTALYYYLHTNKIETNTIFSFLIVFALLSVLSCLALIDAKTMEIPNGFIIIILVLGILSYFVFPQISLIDRLIGFVCISLPMFLLCLAIPGAFGGGDIKLMAVCGLFLGWKLNLFAMFVGILTGGFWGIYLLISKKKGRKEHFAFGPFLCFGVAVAWFFGENIISWYLSLYHF